MSQRWHDTNTLPLRYFFSWIIAKKEIKLDPYAFEDSWSHLSSNAFLRLRLESLLPLSLASVDFLKCKLRDRPTDNTAPLVEVIVHLHTDDVESLLWNPIVQMRPYLHAFAYAKDTAWSAQTPWAQNRGTPRLCPQNSSFLSIANFVNTQVLAWDALLAACGAWALMKNTKSSL